MATYPTFNAQQILRGSQLRAMQTELIVCTSPDTVTAASDEKIDTELFFQLEANASYTVESMVLFRNSGSDTAAVSRWLGSVLLAGNVGLYMVLSPSEASAGASFVTASNTTANMRASSSFAVSQPQVNSDNTNSAVWAKFNVTTGSVPEVVYHSWAQSPLGGAGSVTRDAGSYMRITRFA